MKRCRSTENADDHHKIDGTEKNPDANQNTDIKDNAPEEQHICNHNGGGDDSNDNGSEQVRSSAEEGTIENSKVGFPSDGEEENEEDDYEEDEEDEAEGLNHNFSVEHVRERIAKLICFQEVPPQIVKNKNFQEMMIGQCPSLIMDFSSTKSDCLRIYEEEKVKIKDIVNNMGRSIALSVDVLTYYQNWGPSHDFLCIAAHFIDDDWKLKKWVLRFQRHNTTGSDFIDEAILKTMREWNILDKVANLTSKDAHEDFFESEVLSMIKAQINENRKLPLDSRLFSVPCVAEIFSLMAQDAFNSIDNTIDKIKVLSWSNSESMWHLTDSKLKDALDLKSLGEFDSGFVHIDYDVPSSDEWDKAKIVHRLVESTYNVAKQMFETKYPTSNKFLYNLQELRAILIKECTTEDSFTSNLAKKMLEKLEKYLKDMFLLLAIASVMDPRLKMQYIEYMSSKFDDTNGSFQSGPVLEAIRGLYAEYSNQEMKIKYPEASLNPKAEQDNPNSDWFQEFSQFVQINNQPQKSDLDLYLEEPVSPWSDDFNTLQWWRSEGPKYPTVAKMVRDILAIPLSVATSYEAYYYLENRPPDERVIGLGAELMNAMMCCWSWNPRTVPDLDMWLLACGVAI